MPPKQLICDGNEAVASVAHRINETIAIYPITPASPMGELSDAWSAQGRRNIWGVVPQVVEMQSEGGAAGAVHGALQAGALVTSFTSSQGLLLMIPNLYKIAGELTPFCLHVAARSLATHALSIFGDHSDVMSCRGTGFALLGAASVQESHDFACVAQAASLRSRVPFLHFFDGFRTSHEINRIEVLSDDDLRALIDPEAVAAHREHALTPDRPVLRGTAQNPDTFFQAREACNPFYDACPDVVRDVFARFAERTGRSYRLFDYFGHPEAERVIVQMGSGVTTARETVEHLAGQGQKVGLVAVRLFRPFSIEAFVEALPKSVRSIAALDRTKEPGAIGDPLYLDVVAALEEARERGIFGGEPRVVGGRYGLSSKEYTPSMVKAVLDALDHADTRRHFTVGIVDDVTHTSIDFDADFDIEPEDSVRAVFFGLGSDGTVGANKNTIKIIGESTEQFVQGYFVYDSKKSGAVTVSHLRFGPRPISATYLVRRASFVACHQFEFLEKIDVLGCAEPGAVLLLNAPHDPERVWDALPRERQEEIIEKNLRVYAIDGYRLAREIGLGGRINTIMQTCFFALSGVLPREEAIASIKEAIQSTYGKLGPSVVEKNFQAVDRALDNLHEIPVPSTATSERHTPPIVPDIAPDFVKKVTAVMMAGKGDLLPVSAFPVDGTWPTATTRWEKRRIAREIPVWDPKICIECNKCAMVCPHATIRAKVFEPASLEGAPDSFEVRDAKTPDYRGLKYRIQVAPEDCTGCRLCVAVCPAKDRSNPRHKAIDMEPLPEHLEVERENFDFFLEIPEIDRSRVKLDVRGTQLLEPLFEFSGACAGCGETPYVKLLTQLFGDRTLIANATGCSSIYGGNLPTTPYTVDRNGRGPAWSNSLFEDNAEFGFGFRLALDYHLAHATELLTGLASQIGDTLVKEILGEKVHDDAAVARQRARVVTLRQKLSTLKSAEAARLSEIADYLVPKSVWIVGGDGWAYDIGFGGLDHILAMRRNVNVLVLDTEVYSNTGGQQSKATPLGATAKFASSGKTTGKKDLGLIAMSYGHVYVAQVAFGAKDAQTVQAFQEAESHDGPSLIIAYSHCIAHGYDMAHGANQQKLAASSGIWPLYRFDPRRTRQGQPPLRLETTSLRASARDYMLNEARFRSVERRDPELFRQFLDRAQRQAEQRFEIYRQLSNITVPSGSGNGDGGTQTGE